MSVKSKIVKVVSGGQTGVDRAALDAAIALGIAHGGWCPRGRRAEDGIIDKKYELQETPRRDYSQRTIWNVRDSDATLVLSWGPIERGTALTVEVVEDLQKPLLLFELKGLSFKKAGADFHLWVRQHSIQVLNIAGPRENRQKLIYPRARETITQLLNYSEF